VSLPRPGQVRLEDDGPGVPAERRIALQQALDAQAYEGRMGLGLMLADMVARSHGGRLLLPPTAAGFAAELHLAP
jgi:nitrogen-specific signal transduction histidine kinase